MLRESRGIHGTSAGIFEQPHRLFHARAGLLSQTKLPLSLSSWRLLVVTDTYVY